MGPIGCPETSVRNCPYSLRNDPEERRAHLLPNGSLLSRVAFLEIKSKPSASELNCSMVIFCPFRGRKWWFTRTDHEPVTNWPRTGHEPATNRLRTDYVATTNRPRTDHEPVTNRPRTDHEPATNRPRTGNEPTTTGHEPVINRLRTCHSKCLITHHPKC